MIIDYKIRFLKFQFHLKENDSTPTDDDFAVTLHGANQFVTKTCLTTFTYLTTYLQDGRTTVESREKVISNTATEERNTIHIAPTPTAGITLTQVRDLNTDEHFVRLLTYKKKKTPDFRLQNYRLVFFTRPIPILIRYWTVICHWL